MAPRFGLGASPLRYTFGECLRSKSGWRSEACVTKVHLGRSLLALAIVLGLAGCGPDPNETQINARVKSPDGNLVAIYAEDLSGGPATGVSEDVYVTLGARFPQTADRVFSNECVHQIALSWEGPRRLRISYDVASDIHENTGLGRPWWAMWDQGLVHGVQVHLVRHLTPATRAC